MRKRRRERRILVLLLVCALLVYGLVFFAARQRQRIPTEYAQTQLAAAELLAECFNQVKAYKAELGIPLSEEDYHETGMIGESFTGITTTLGAIEAKRTTAWPDMGALCVRLLYEAGVRPGDTVGAGFSGSFPAMNLAVIAACQVMNVKLVYISSVGASTYGANNPELTFPEMAHRLVEDGLLETDSTAVTMGGDQDVGGGMVDPALREEIRSRLLEMGLPLLEEPDFHRNLQLRQQIYQENGPIDCFVAVGGNITSMGLGEVGIGLGQGVLSPQQIVRLTPDSGLVQRYLSEGIPAINLLNIRKLVTDYGLPYDPDSWPEMGSSAVYYVTSYPLLPIGVGLGAAAVLLILCRYERTRVSAVERTAMEYKVVSGEDETNG